MENTKIRPNSKNKIQATTLTHALSDFAAEKCILSEIKHAACTRFCARKGWTTRGFLLWFSWKTGDE